MGAISTRFRSLWLTSLILPLLAGVIAFVVESTIRPNHVCVTGSPSHGLRYFVVFLALAVLPGALTAVVGWRSGREGEDTVGPVVAALVLAVTFVFFGLLLAWGGHGCIT